MPLPLFVSAIYPLGKKVGTLFAQTGFRLRCSSAIVSARLDGYIGKGVFGARERDTQRLPYADFFGYVLVRRQESNITARKYLNIF